MELDVLKGKQVRIENGFFKGQIGVVVEDLIEQKIHKVKIDGFDYILFFRDQLSVINSERKKEEGKAELNQKVADHKKVLDEMLEIYKRKNHDYGNSTEKTYLENGIITALVRIKDKLHRIESLAGKNNQLVKDESIIDSCLDAANYFVDLANNIKRHGIIVKNLGE